MFKNSIVSYGLAGMRGEELEFQNIEELHVPDDLDELSNMRILHLSYTHHHRDEHYISHECYRNLFEMPIELSWKENAQVKDIAAVAAEMESFDSIFSILRHPIRYYRLSPKADDLIENPRVAFYTDLTTGILPAEIVLVDEARDFMKELAPPYGGKIADVNAKLRNIYNRHIAEGNPGTSLTLMGIYQKA